MEKLELRFETTKERYFIGMSIEMSLADNKTGELFRTFMPRKKEILNTKSQSVFDLIIYPNSYFKVFNPATCYKKHAMVEVPNFENVPDGMETLILPKGKYAVFSINGYEPNPAVFQYIYSEWVPNNSDYQLDDRPHFDILTEKIQQQAEDAVQEIWVPVFEK